MTRARPRQPPAPRKQPVQARATVTIDAIVVAVSHILERHGPAGLTTNRIAEVAGVSIGTLYQYFPNKEALVAALHQRYLDEAIDLARCVLAGAGAVPIPQLAHVLAGALVELDRSQRPIHRWLAEMRTVADFHLRFHAAIDALIEDATAFLANHPALALPDPANAARVIVLGVEGMVAGLGARPTLDRHELATQAAEMVSAYLAKFSRDVSA